VDDAELVDQEERLSTENYNDIVSYRYPLYFASLWQSRNVGYRVNAGSLNASRFYFEEEIKLETDRLQRLGFAFNRSRMEDFLERRSEDEIRLFASPFDHLRVSLLGDGGADKEYGDMGMAIALYEGAANEIEFFYWSVDHYYDQKKQKPEDKRSKNSFTTGAKGQLKLEDFSAKFYYERDHPLLWQRLSEGYEYAYLRQFAKFGGTYHVADHQDYYFDIVREQKEEGKVFYASQNSKSYVKDSIQYELGRNWYGDDDQSIGIMKFDRRVQYVQSGNFQSFEESISPESSKRNEWGLFYSRYLRRSWFNQQFGLYSNRVFIYEKNPDITFSNWETKIQWLMDFEIQKGCQLVLNTTWDVDQLYKDYPYKGDQTFKPWGGGNIQILAAF
jgi:hypothetical protein